MRGIGAQAHTEVFAVGTHDVQVMWRSWPATEITVEVGPVTATAVTGPPAWLRRRGRQPVLLSGHVGGPGALTLPGLRPGTRYQVHVAGPGIARRRVADVTTLTPPPGPVLARFATISDLHIGESSFGALGTIEEEVPLAAGAAPYPMRSAQAAISEATAWGSQLLVVKGDLTADSEPAEFREVGQLLSRAAIPSLIALGNHDVRRRGGDAMLRSFGLLASSGTQHFDLPGARIITGHSPHPRQKRGYLEAAQRHELAAAAAGTDAAAIVVLHHPPQRWRWPTHYPPGLVQGDSLRLLRQLGVANRRTVVLAGHTHRNRRYRLRGITVAEVGATKDYPGQWAGYTVYEEGLVQVVYRIEDPGVIAWTESTRLALGGIWGWWSIGERQDRCWVQAWSP
ncbi:MAG: metallophosphoesterase [Actinomycetota bacterium]|nr:metallophosphoesterase [Actinomycetota bacterium]